MKKLYQIFLLLTRGKQIAVVVGLMHLLALFSLTFHHLITSRLKPPRPMVVKTIAVPAKKAMAAVQSQPSKANPQAASSSKSAKTQTAAAPQKQTKKAVAAKPSKPSGAATAAKKTINTSVLKEIAESFDSISSSRPAAKEKHSLLHIPAKITRETPVAGEDEKSDEDATYGEYLIAFLQSSLDLPEYGEVKMEIEIDSFGKLVDCKILESKSKKNADFLRKELVQLSYPIPQLNRLESSKRFAIAFKNL